MTQESLLIYRTLWGGYKAEFIDGSWGELNAWHKQELWMSSYLPGKSVELIQEEGRREKGRQNNKPAFDLVTKS